VKEALVEVTLRRLCLRIWVFVAEITDEFNLGLVVLRVYDTSVDLVRHLLRLSHAEVTLWYLEARPPLSRGSLVSDEVIPALCERVVTARLEAPVGTANGLVEPSLKTSREGLYMARTSVRARPTVPVRIMNVTNQDQVLSEVTTIGQLRLTTRNNRRDGREGLVKNSRTWYPAPGRT
jgi:hypothetical protein